MTLDSGAPAGQTRTEPAGQTDEPDRDEQVGATATGVPEPASTATGGLAGTGLDGEPGTSASASGSLGLDREPPDASFIESEQGRGDGQAELSATGGGGPVASAGHDQLPVGEGVSRPLVDETPARPAVVLAGVGVSLGRCGCGGIWSPRW